MASLVESRKDVEKTTRSLNQELNESPDLQRRLAFARGWYYLPELDAVGFSKFIGYADMTVEKYDSQYNDDLWGGQTEVRLKRWFAELQRGSPEFEYVERKVRTLLGKFGRWPSRAARYNAPRGWSLPAGRVAEAPTAYEASAASEEERRPGIAEIFRRAFSTLHSEEQDAVAEEILKERRATALSALEAPVLAELWNNPADAAYDKL